MIPPVQPVQISGFNPANGPAGAAAAKGDGAGFATAVGDALSEVGRRDNAVTAAAESAAAGDLRSVSDYMVAATEAQLATEITVAVRDRAISAFNDIMRMQL
ncbi:MAG: flagellar hook-basal body complex protein FliE [Acidimicrobiales bacterium]